MLGNFSCFCCLQLTFQNPFFFSKIKFYQEHYQSVKKFGSRSGSTFCRSWFWSKLIAKIFSRQQKSPQARKSLKWRQFKKRFKSCLLYIYVFPSKHAADIRYYFSHEGRKLKLSMLYEIKQLSALSSGDILWWPIDPNQTAPLGAVW